MKYELNYSQNKSKNNKKGWLKFELKEKNQRNCRQIEKIVHQGYNNIARDIHNIFIQLNMQALAESKLI